MMIRKIILTLWISFLFTIGCQANRHATEGCAVSISDKCNGLILSLKLDKKQLRNGETFSATTTLQNTTEIPLALHYLDITPMNVFNPVTDKPIPIGEFGHSWRYAYYNPIVLECRTGVEYGNNGLLAYPLPVNDNFLETKQWYKATLQAASYGNYYPNFVIPARSTVTTTQSFKASKDRPNVDVGLFCLENYYTENVLKASEEGFKHHSSHYDKVKLRPKIWIGSLYVGIELDVERNVETVHRAVPK